MPVILESRDIRTASISDWKCDVRYAIHSLN